jgi:hypothetical protein
MVRIRTHLLALVVAWLAMASVFMAVSARATTVKLARGQLAGYPWRLTVSTRTLGRQRVPALCASLLVAGSGFPACTAPAIGRREGRRFGWSFDLHAAGYHGVVALVAAEANDTVRDLIVFVDPRASRVAVTLADGEVFHLRAHALHASLHRAARIAWQVDVPSHNNAKNLTFAKVLAYSRRGAVVGHYR